MLTSQESTSPRIYSPFSRPIQRLAKGCAIFCLVLSKVYKTDHFLLMIGGGGGGVGLPLRL